MPFAQAAPIPFSVCPVCLSAGGTSAVTALNDLTDVVITGPVAAGQVLHYNGVTWVNEPFGFDDLLDGDSTTVAPLVGQAPVWDGTNWVPGNAASANPTVHLTETAIAPAIAGDPTLAEITAAAAPNLDRMLTYTGTDVDSDPIVRVYHIDSAGTVTLVEEPPTATCALREIGGASSGGAGLTVGLGVGVPNPLQTGYTVSADRMAAVITTPPAGGSTEFEVRLHTAPATYSVLSTGTFAAGATMATFTAYADTVVTSAMWFESVVTAVAPTPGDDFTVAAELCGPGTPTTVGAGGADTDSAFHTQAVAATTWTITHGLPFTPAAIHIEDGAGGDVTPDDVMFGPTTVVVTFLTAQAGTARIS